MLLSIYFIVIVVVIVYVKIVVIVVNIKVAVHAGVLSNFFAVTIDVIITLLWYYHYY